MAHKANLSTFASYKLYAKLPFLSLIFFSKRVPFARPLIVIIGCVFNMLYACYLPIKTVTDRNLFQHNQTPRTLLRAFL